MRGLCVCGRGRSICAPAGGAAARIKKMAPLTERSAGNFGAGREGPATSADGLREDFDRRPAGSKNRIEGCGTHLGTTCVWVDEERNAALRERNEALGSGSIFRAGWFNISREYPFPWNHSNLTPKPNATLVTFENYNPLPTIKVLIFYF
jgi:hypothetical protein